VRVKSRAAASERRRGAILKAALACFLERGFAATTTEQIRERSGASIGSIYHHFGGKEQLAGALHLQGLQDYQQGFLRELRRHRDAKSGVRAVIRYHLRWVDEHPDWARYLFYLREAEATRSVEEKIRDAHRRFSAAVAAWAAPHVRKGIMAPLPPDVTGALWIGPAQQFARQWLAGHALTSLERAAALLGDAAWKALSTGTRA
jgi:AcrR family transcriptional regulator